MPVFHRHSISRDSVEVSTADSASADTSSILVPATKGIRPFQVFYTEGGNQQTTPSVATVTEALTNGLTTIGNNLMTAIGSVLPIALPILGAIAVVGVGISIFNRVRKGRGG